MSNAGGFLSNLYRDLRDRRLLPVVALLVVGIVAVPMLLRAQPEEVPPPPPVAATTSDTSEAVPAVLADVEGIRDYRKRLNALRTKNPFEDHFAPPPVTTDLGLPPEETGAPIDSSGATSGDVTDITVEPISEPPADTGGGTSGSTDTVEETDTSIDTGGTEPGEVITEEYRLSYRVDVMVGPTGEAKKQEDVKMLSFLPSRKRPVAVFVGVTETDERAVFMLSTDVTGSTGEGECSPSAVNCQFITLKEGHHRTLTYAPEGAAPQNFTLELSRIKLVVVDEGEDAIPDGADRDANSASVPSGMAAWLGLGA